MNAWLARSIGLVVVAGAFCAGTVGMLAQTATAKAPVSADGKPATFEVVSVREEKPGAGQQGAVRVESTPDGYRMEGVPLMALIQIAYVPSQWGYHFGPNQITGVPDWFGPIRYDIEAKVSEADLPKWNDAGLQPAMLREMLRALLADRFKLLAHRETRRVPVYEITVGGRGPKFKSSAGATLAEIRQTHPNARALGNGAIVANGPNPGQQWLFGATMPVLGEFLSTLAGRPIQDKTRLTGRYDLTWQIEMPSSSQQGAALAPDFFSQQIVYVVQDQLGLKLRAAEGPMESLVIDHVERPSEN